MVVNKSNIKDLDLKQLDGKKAKLAYEGRSDEGILFLEKGRLYLIGTASGTYPDKWPTDPKYLGLKYSWVLTNNEDFDTVMQRDDYQFEVLDNSQEMFPVY